jgi:methyl-accepting chemotaxis protein
MVEQSTAASGHLAEEAAKLRELVSRFKLRATASQSATGRRGGQLAA